MKKAASFSLKMQVKELIFSPVIRFKPATLLMKNLIKMLLKILTADLPRHFQTECLCKRRYKSHASYRKARSKV